MSRAVICFFLYFMGISAMNTSNSSTDSYIERDNLQAMQNFEETARRQWELSSRKRPTTVLDETGRPEASSSEAVELFTWFPWFQKNGPTIHTIKAIATLKKENDSRIPAILGVGSWHEIVLFGNKKELNSNEEPDASALSRSSANALQWFIISIPYFVYLLAI